MIVQFREPCWVLAVPESSSDPHCPTREEAVAACGDSGGAVYRRPELCWYVVCDRCGEVRATFDVEGYECEHHGSLGDAEAAQRELGALCEDCETAVVLGSVSTRTGAVVVR
ncbi:hypothetical protein K1T35_47735 (plasmid) [Pseudonocardia sp. DSM 110487]|uniref:hypothetical protein n=1 Tax=Pseudonocardia sp. DSM 110487 TaxID=2865833 RepID=UPI001C6A0982|nr:hypothetical protein [Pseudonocardia sp. DSM 110487]QYN41043.1 hypothetical protein K1T35_47735 [Pseudonocardia sp. DSM 110487]